MKFSKFILIACSLFIFACSSTPEIKSGNRAVSSDVLNDDDDLYLEEVYGKDALQWVESENAKSLPTLMNDPGFEPLRKKLLENLNAKDQLKSISLRKGVISNFWRDEINVRGIYRTTDFKSYRLGRPNWTIHFDLDQISKLENENWVYKGSFQFKNRLMLRLSRGGKDASVYREFDLIKNEFVKDGFVLGEGKHSLAWIDEDTMLLGYANDQVTDSGYPMTVRIWQRGQKPEDAPIIFSGNKKDVSVSAYASRDEVDGPVKYIFIYQSFDFYNSNVFEYTKSGLKKLPLPTDADFSRQKEYAYVHLKSDFKPSDKIYSSGSLIRTPIKNLLEEQKNYELVFSPEDSGSILSSYVYLGDRVFLGLLKDVSSKWVEIIKGKAGAWTQKPLRLPENSDISVVTGSEEDNLLILGATGFLNPTIRYYYDLKINALKVLEKSPSRFDAKKYKVTQYFAMSKDGTKVPYYLVAKKNIRLNATTPVVINAYGGFEISQTPFYSFAVGLGWLESGGAFVSANIRGGGEYGPKWHQSVLKQNRQKAFDDFHAVAEDLIAKKLTKPSLLGAFGGSNGGLLMGVAFTQRPDLYGAIAVQVPLLDMLRYTKLLAGASWVGEYGDPNIPEERAALKRYSPYHNLNHELNYPEVFFMTSTADDRVHPGHARRMAARMKAMGKPYLYYENTEGGHGGSANNEQRAKWWALQYTYFKQKLLK